MSKPKSPYVGPRPLGGSDLLYGRDWEVTELHQLLITRRVVLFHAPSGAGKTSLITAGMAWDPRTDPKTDLPQRGLIARLRAEGLQCLGPVRVGHPLQKDAFAPEQQQIANRYTVSVIDSLESAWHGDDAGRGAAESSDPPTPEEAVFRSRKPARLPADELPEMRLKAYFELIDKANDSPRPQVLIFDQFEEFLTADPFDLDAKIGFLKQLDAVLADPRRRVLFAMRTDYVGALDPFVHVAPDRLQNRFCLDLLSEHAAKAAILGPTTSLGLQVSEEAADALIEELRQVVVQRAGDAVAMRIPGPFIEPVHLQLVCDRLWNKCEKVTGSIDTGDVEKHAKVDDALGDYYDDSIREVVTAEVVSAFGTGLTIRRADAPKITEEHIRNWIESKLISRHGFRGQIAMEPGRVTEGLPNTAIDVLVDRYLVRREPRRGVTWFELSHDSFIEPIRERNRMARGRLDVDQLRERARATTSALIALILVGVIVGVQLYRRQLAQDDRIGTLASKSRLDKAREHLRAHRNLSALTLLAATQPGEDSLAARALFAKASQNLWTSRQTHEGAATSIAFRRDLSMVSSGVDRRVLGTGATETFTLTLPEAAPNGSTLSPDGTRIVTLDQDRMATLVELPPNGRPVRLARSALTPVFSNDGSTIALYDGKEVKLFDRKGEPTGPRDMSAQDIVALAISDHGERVVAVEARAKLHIWPPFGVPRPALGQIESIALSPGGERLAIAYANGALVLVSSTVRELPERVAGVDAMAFSPDGTSLAVLTHGGAARVFSALDGKPQTPLMSTEALAEDSRGAAPPRDAAGTSDGGIKDAEIREAEESSDRRKASARDSRSADTRLGTRGIVAFSADSSLLLTAGPGLLATLWDAATGQRLVSYEEADPITAAQLSPDASTVVLATSTGSVRTWPALLGDSRPISILAGEPIVHVATGETALAVATAKTVHVRHEDGGHYRTPCIGDVIGIRFVDRTSLAVICKGRAEIWKWRETAHRLLLLESGISTGVAFTPDGAGFAISRNADDDSGPAIVVFTSNAGMWTKTSLPTHGDVTQVAVSPRANRVAALHKDGRVRVWDVSSKALLAQLPPGLAQPSFDSAGEYLLCTWTHNSDPQASVMWEIDGGHAVPLAAETRRLVQLSDFSVLSALSDDKRVVAAAKDGSVMVLEAARKDRSVWADSLKWVQDGPRHRSEVIVIDEGDRRVLTASRSGDVHIWDPATGDVLATLVQGDEVTAAAFTRDHKAVLVANASGNASTWNTPIDNRALRNWAELARGCSPFRIKEGTIADLERVPDESKSCADLPEATRGGDRVQRASNLRSGALVRLPRDVDEASAYLQLARKALEPSDTGSDASSGQDLASLRELEQIDRLDDVLEGLRRPRQLDSWWLLRGRIEVAENWLLRPDIARTLHQHVKTGRSIGAFLIAGATLNLGLQDYPEADQLARQVIADKKQAHHQVIAFALLWSVARLTPEGGSWMTLLDVRRKFSPPAELDAAACNLLVAYGALKDGTKLDRRFDGARHALRLGLHPAGAEQVAELLELLEQPKDAQTLADLEEIVGGQRRTRPLPCRTRP